jgi:adenylate kinase
MKRILLAGLPGSGKTTQAKRLAEELGLCVVSVGDALREMAKEDSELGNVVKEEMSKGDFVDDALAARVVRQKVNSEACTNGFVVDGYPRSLGQIEQFDPEFNQIIFLDISKKVAEKRLLSRGRMDDDPKVIEHRLNVYEEHTKPIIDYFKNLGLVKEVDGDEEIDVVFERIKEVLI